MCMRCGTSAAATTPPTVTPQATGTSTPATRSSAPTNPARTGGGVMKTICPSMCEAHHPHRRTPDRPQCRIQPTEAGERLRGEVPPVHSSMKARLSTSRVLGHLRRRQDSALVCRRIPGARGNGRPRWERDTMGNAAARMTSGGGDEVSRSKAHDAWSQRRDDRADSVLQEDPLPVQMVQLLRFTQPCYH
jgi:hypothetical protein